jgi:hypothetical protein
MKLYHHTKKLKLRYLLLAALASGIVCLFALRANNEHMLSLRDAVYRADQKGSGVQAALQNLQAYVTTHMNTNLSTGTSVYPPIQLKYTYDRLVQAQGVELQKQNGQLYTDAQAYCEAQNSKDFSGRNRVPCIQQYVQDHGVKIPPIEDSLYKFGFVSPRWSADLAGWSMAITLLLLLTSAITFLARLLSK